MEHEPPKPGIWAAYERFRAEADLSEIDGSEFDGIRDRSPGRDVILDAADHRPA